MESVRRRICHESCTSMRLTSRKKTALPFKVGTYVRQQTRSDRLLCRRLSSELVISWVE